MMPDTLQILFYLPILFDPLRPWPDLLAVLVTYGGLQILVRNGAWGTSAEVSLLVGSLLILQLYLPLLAMVPMQNGIFLGLLLSVWMAAWMNVALKSSRRISRTFTLNFKDWWESIPIPVYLGLAFPLVLGVLVLSGFQFSPIEVPEALRPWGGLRTLVAGSTAFLFIHWLLFSGGGATQSNLIRIGQLSKRCCGILTVLFFGRLLLFLLVGGLNLVVGTPTPLRYDAVLSTSKSLAITQLDWLVRKQVLSVGLTPEISIDEWVRWAKDADHDPFKALAAPSPLAKFLVKGGASIPIETEQTGDHPAVGIAVSADHQNLYVLFDQGMLVKISEGVTVRTFPPELGGMVHIRLDQQQRPLLLEISGRLTRIEAEGQSTVLAQAISRDTGFRRLAVHPTTGEIFALDLYGVFYRIDAQGHWQADERFKPYSQSGDLTYDIARDITISPSGTIYLLDCFGRVYSSSLASSEIKGPTQNTHYWPGNPLGQSIQASSNTDNSYTVVDRYGGIFPKPDPRCENPPTSLEAYRLPTSLPRKDQDIVDHVFLEPQRWIYLLTRNGQVLTNYRWADTWAE